MKANILYERGTGGKLFLLTNVELVDAGTAGFVLYRKDGRTASLNDKFIIEIEFV